jgi:hypothetical protein
MSSPTLRSSNTISKKDAYTERMVVLSRLIREFPRNGMYDENDIPIGTYEWYAKRIVEIFREQGRFDQNGELLLPSTYLIGGSVAAAAVSRDWNRFRKKHMTQARQNLEVIREREVEELERIKSRLYDMIMQLEVLFDWEGLPVRVPSKAVKFVNEYVRISERLSKLLGLDAPTRTIGANIQIPWDKLTRDQLDRIESGESPVSVLADMAEENVERMLGAGDDDEENIIDAEAIPVGNS